MEIGEKVTTLNNQIQVYNNSCQQIPSSGPLNTGTFPIEVTLLEHNQHFNIYQHTCTLSQLQSIIGKTAQDVGYIPACNLKVDFNIQHQVINQEDEDLLTRILSGQSVPGFISNNQDVIVIRYDSSLSNPNGIYEKMYYSQEWGWILWEEYSKSGNSLNNRSHFYRIEDNPLKPLKTSICLPDLKPAPTKTPVPTPSAAPRQVVPCYQQETQIGYGDINGDGKITIQDPSDPTRQPLGDDQLIKNYLTSLFIDPATNKPYAQVKLKRMDVNGDAKVSNRDVITLQRYVQRFENTFPICNNQVYFYRTPPCYQPGTGIGYGDIDGDGYVTTKKAPTEGEFAPAEQAPFTDAVYPLRRTAGFLHDPITHELMSDDPQKIARMNVNNDGTVGNSVDALCIMKYAQGLINNFPVCTETTADDTACLDPGGGPSPEPQLPEDLGSKVPVCSNFGNVNEDHIINQQDLDLIASTIEGKQVLTDERKRFADVNGNGVVDYGDIEIIENYLLGSTALFSVCQPITISNITSQIKNESGSKSIALTWTSSNPGSSRVCIGDSRNSLTQNPTQNCTNETLSLNTTHQVSLPIVSANPLSGQLQTKKIYYYQVYSNNGAGTYKSDIRILRVP